MDCICANEALVGLCVLRESALVGPSRLLSILYSYGRQQKTMHIDVTEQSFLAVVHVTDCCITNMDIRFYSKPGQRGNTSKIRTNAI